MQPRFLISSEKYGENNLKGEHNHQELIRSGSFEGRARRFRNTKGKWTYVDIVKPAYLTSLHFSSVQTRGCSTCANIKYCRPRRRHFRTCHDIRERNTSTTYARVLQSTRRHLQIAISVYTTISRRIFAKTMEARAFSHRLPGHSVDIESVYRNDRKRVSKRSKRRREAGPREKRIWKCTAIARVNA